MTESLPFSTAEFLGVFAEYNRLFGVVVVAWWVATLAVLIFVWRAPARRSPRLSTFLGGLWLWNAVAYHALLFTSINPAAWLFALLFVAQAFLFFGAARSGRVEYFSAAGWRRVIGMALMGYALSYPALTIASGHRYPAAPTFGVPCPTDLLTIGVLLTLSGRVPATLAVIPLLWAMVGGSAAMLLAVPTDYVLLAAALPLGIAVRASAERRAA